MWARLGKGMRDRSVCQRHGFLHDIRLPSEPLQVDSEDNGCLPPFILGGFPEARSLKGPAQKGSSKVGKLKRD